MQTSATATETFDHGCMVRYVRRYVLKNMPRTPLSRFGALGNAIHSTYEQMFKFELFQDPKYLINLFTKNFNLEFSKSSVEKLPDREKGGMYGYGKKVLLSGYNTLKKNNLLIRPLIAEEWFNVPLSIEDGMESLGHSIGGKIDAVFEVDNSFFVIDYKTGKEMPSPLEVRSNLQLTTYSFVIKKLYNRECDVGLLYARHEKVLKTKRNQRDFVKLGSILKDMVKLETIDSDKGLEINPSPRACQWCELRANKSCEGPKQIGLED